VAGDCLGTAGEELGWAGGGWGGCNLCSLGVSGAECELVVALVVGFSLAGQRGVGVGRGSGFQLLLLLLLLYEGCGPALYRDSG
jgi:hypothetical protein